MSTTLIRLLAVIVTLVLSMGAARPAEIHDAAKTGNLSLVRALLEKNPALVEAKDDLARTPLHWACRGVHLEVVRLLVERGADVNARDANGVTPLHSVSSRGDVGAAGILLDRGASFEARMSDLSTPLHLAAANGRSEVVSLLVERGAPLDVQDGKEDTPLHAAAHEAHWDIIGLLVGRIRAGQRAGLDAPDFDGCTVLHLAGEAGQTDTAKLLLSRGAGLDLRNTRGQSAYNLAVDAGFKDLAAYLAENGADQGPQRFPGLSGPYLGQTPPGETPQLFAKGIVSTRRGMYGTIVFSPDGQEAFWKPEGPEMLGMKRDRGVWSPPVGFTFATKESLNVPFFSLDGRRLYFMAGTPNAQGIIEKEAIWHVEKTGAGWSDPKPFDPTVNSVNMHWQFSMDRNGDVYLNANAGIYRARFVDGRYLAPEPLPAPVNVNHTQEEKYRAGELGPFISPAGDYLIFSKFGGGSRLFVSFKKSDGSWAEPRNLSERLQTEGNDSLANVTPDGKYLFFQSVRRGSGASRGLYWVDARVIEALRPKEK
jgi:ankyrin repeat protein